MKKYAQRAQRSLRFGGKRPSRIAIAASPIFAFRFPNIVLFIDNRSCVPPVRKTNSASPRPSAASWKAAASSEVTAFVVFRPVLMHRKILAVPTSTSSCAETTISASPNLNDSGVGACRLSPFRTNRKNCSKSLEIWRYSEAYPWSTGPFSFHAVSMMAANSASLGSSFKRDVNSSTTAWTALCTRMRGDSARRPPTCRTWAKKNRRGHLS